VNLTTPDATLESQASKSVIDLSQADILRFSDMLLKQCGLRFPESRHAELVHGIRQAFAASTCSNLDEFYNLVQDPQVGAMEMDLLVNSVTISETHFFRDQAQFNAIIDHVLPQIIERKRPLRTLRIWSAGCASGEEPYSLAILLRELLPDVDQWSITILATDINSASLERARQATYGGWAFREARAKDLRSRYFVSASNNRFALIPEVRRMVIFNKLNLVEPCFPAYETNTMMMDLIICRNVTIYFSESITRWVVDRFYDSLVVGGWLVVGHSEPSVDIYRKFRVRNYPDTVLYQRASNTAVLHALGSRRLLPSPLPIPLPPEATLVPTPLQARSSLIQGGDTLGVIPTAPEKAKDANPLEHARELLEYGRSEDACNILLVLAKHQPGDTAVYSLLGKAYANLGNWEEAENWCRQAIECNKLVLDAYYTLALVLQHQEKLDQAIENMKKVVYIDRAYIIGHYGLATLYYENNQLSQAQKSLENALRLLQNRPDDGTIPGSQGITIGRLRSAITNQQQAWGL
jgi:chemotaxis protein methyltransferase CheR